MFELLTANNLQNVYTPLSFNVHFIFCIIATILYLVQYYRKRSLYYLFIMAAIDLTFVTQYSTEKYVIITLFVTEIILLVLAFFFSHRYNKKIKAENAASEAEKAKELSDKKEAEKAFSQQEKKIVDNAFDDKEGL